MPHLQDGEVDRSMTGIAEKLTREVDGVVGVVNQLTWSFDDTVPAPGTGARFA